MKKIVLLICLIFFSVLSSFSIDCEYTFKIQNKEYCSIMSNDYNLKSYKYNKKANVYSIDLIHDMMDSNSHQIYKSPRNGKYITHLIHRIYYKDGRVSVKCIGYITGDFKLFYDNDGKITDNTYINLKTFMERPSSIKDIKEFEDMYSSDYDRELHEKIIKFMANTY